MKLKYIVLALCAGQLGLANAQETAVKEAPAKEAKEAAMPTFEAKTPLEKHALKVITIFGDFPNIIGGIKDDATADQAKVKIEGMFKKLNAEAELIKKLPVPDNDTRKALAKKMEPLQKAMDQKMQSSMMKMMTLPPELAPKIQGMMMSLGPQMEGFGATMEKYFEPDKETPKVEEKK